MCCHGGEPVWPHSPKHSGKAPRRVFVAYFAIFFTTESLGTESVGMPTIAQNAHPQLQPRKVLPTPSQSRIETSEWLRTAEPEISARRGTQSIRWREAVAPDATNGRNAPSRVARSTPSLHSNPRCTTNRAVPKHLRTLASQAGTAETTYMQPSCAHVRISDTWMPI
jgi:hypothetical protein